MLPSYVMPFVWVISLTARVSATCGVAQSLTEQEGAMRVTIRCPAMGMSLSVKQWKLNGSPCTVCLNGNGLELIIQNIGLNNSGTYVCTINNPSQSDFECTAATLSVVPLSSIQSSLAMMTVGLTSTGTNVANVPSSTDYGLKVSLTHNLDGSVTSSSFYILPSSTMLSQNMPAPLQGKDTTIVAAVLGVLLPLLALLVFVVVTIVLFMRLQRKKNPSIPQSIPKAPQAISLGLGSNTCFVEGDNYCNGETITTSCAGFYEPSGRISYIEQITRELEHVVEARCTQASYEV